MRAITVLALSALVPTSLSAQCLKGSLEAPPGPDDSATFGTGLGLDGDTLVVGRPGQWGSISAAPPASGRVEIFHLAGSAPVHLGSLSVPELSAGSLFGHALDLQGDFLAVGAPTDRFHNLTSTGTVSVFRRDASGWLAEGRLRPRGLDDFAGFGSAVAVADGRVVVGAPWHDLNTLSSPTPTCTTGNAGSGAAFVMERRADGTWRFVTLAPSPIRHDSQIGQAVAAQGERVVVGGPGFFCRGGAWVFERREGRWEQTQHLHSPGVTGSEANFGASVSLGGEYLAVAAPGLSSGMVVIYQLRNGRFWQVQTVTQDSTGLPFTYGFGNSVSLNGDWLIVTQPTWKLFMRDNAFHVFKRRKGRFEYTRTMHSPIGTLVGGSRDSSAINSGLYVAGGGDRVAVWDLDGEDCASLLGLPDALSVSQGGTQGLYLAGGSGAAGATYMLAGSASGTSPGFSYLGLTVPLNPDGYFQLTIGARTPIADQAGSLDGTGTAETRLFLPPGAAGTLVGTTLHHAWIGLDPVTGQPVKASEAVPLALLP